MIECLKYKPVNKGTLLGYADLFVPKMGIEIFGCSLHQKDGRRWINLPSREYTDNKGEKKFFSIIRFPNKAHMEEFSKQAKEAIERKAMIEEPKQSSFIDEDVPF